MKKITRGGSEVELQDDGVLNGEHLPPYSGSTSVWRRYFWKPPKTDQGWRHATTYKGWA
jgi:hypothetical protein